MQLHLDLVGGMAGDMFIAALLHAFPQYELRVRQAIDAMNPEYRVACAVLPHHDQVLQGLRFEVALSMQGPVGTHAASHQYMPASPRPGTALAPTSARESHVTWRSIRGRLNDPSSTGDALSSGTRRHAVGIFQLLADAEASVHGVASDSVEFHEVGAWDSVADIVGAAALIDAIGATRWSTSPAPLGFGQVKTAHGMLPIPAPATARLLLGMATLDDGVGGERVTPTGAAILRYLCPPGAGRHSPAARTLISSGTGFGRRTLPGISNHVRVLCFEENARSPTPREISMPREISVLEFEVDDQSGEDLATGLDRLRAKAGVLDVTQAPVFGKKGRMMAHVCVLALHEHVAAVVDTCFRETTTIGLRHRKVEGFGLKRRIEEVEVDGQRLRVKVVDRPGGATAKAESDDVLGHPVHGRRAALRLSAERAALHSKERAVDA